MLAEQLKTTANVKIRSDIILSYYGCMLNISFKLGEIVPRIIKHIA